MNCDVARPLIEAHADGQSPLRRRWALRRHLRSCAACTARAAEARALSARVRAEVPRFAAPATLRLRIAALARGVEPDAGARPSTIGAQRARWLASGAVAGCAATLLASWVATTVMHEQARAGVAQAVIMAHTRATLDHALMAVASNDQHTVKPWLAARLDYAPPVRDLAALGFPLAGARIDEIDGVQVAVLVYRYREHVVDVFVRPSWLPGDMRLPETVRGFHAVGARGHAMDWLAVSDASPEALASLLESLAAPAGR